MCKLIKEKKSPVPFSEEFKNTHPVKVMQDAIQLQKRLCIILVMTTLGGKMHDSSQKLFIWKEKAYFSEQNLAIWDRRGGS